MKKILITLSIPFLFLPTALLYSQTDAVVYSKPSPADKFLAANSGAVLVKADKGKLIYRKADGRSTLVSGLGVSYQQDGQWRPSKLQISAAVDAGAWTLQGIPIDVAFSGNKGNGTDKDLVMKSGAVTFSLHAPQLHYNGDDTFTSWARLSLHPIQ